MLSQYIENEKENILARLFECLRIASISADLQYKETCFKQADWFMSFKWVGI